jgi:hypothetical protein
MITQAIPNNLFPLFNVSNIPVVLIPFREVGIALYLEPIQNF